MSTITAVLYMEGYYSNSTNEYFGTVLYLHMTWCIIPYSSTDFLIDRICEQWYENVVVQLIPAVYTIVYIQVKYR